MRTGFRSPFFANKVRGLSDVSDVRIPQNLSYPGLELNIDRERASLIGLTPKQVVDNVTGIVVSNSILIVEFAGRLYKDGMSYKEAIVESCRIRLRPILMTSFATLLGMIPMAMGLETGSEQYAPLARAIIGGLAVSVVATMYLVPAVYLLIYDRRGKTANVLEETHR